MAEKIKLDGIEYTADNLNENATKSLAALKFTNARLTELENMSALLQRAKNSYVESLKLEILETKSGFLFNK